MMIKRFLILAALATVIAFNVVSDSKHKHQTRHSHSVSSVQFFVGDTELTNANRMSLTDNTLSQSEFDSLRDHFSDSATEHTHRHGHDHVSDHEKVVTQNKVDNILQNALDWCDFAVVILPSDSDVRTRIENNCHRLQRGTSQFGTFQAFIDRLESLTPEANSLDELVRDFVVSAIDECLYLEGHEDHMSLDSNTPHVFQYTGGHARYRYKKYWFVDTE